MAAGVWDYILDEISKAFDGDIVMIDSSCVRVHQHAATGKKEDQDDGCMGRSRGGLTTKIHAVVDADGRPIRLAPRAGQAHDGRMAEPLLQTISKGAILLADKAYDTNAIRAFAKQRQAWANIPAKAIGREVSLSAYGFTGSPISLSVSSANSNSSEASTPVTTKTR